MRQPYFEVGEEIILESKWRPYLNGCYIVNEIFTHQAMCQQVGFEVDKVPDPFFYTMHGLESDHEISGYCRQSSLRKKYERGGDMEEFMSKLRSKCGTEA